jgi:dethiobiotin synthetase
VLTCFVTGTDTGVGKTVVSAAIVAVLRARGLAVRALKPVITGLEDPPDPIWPPDHALLAALTGQTPGQVAPIGFAPAVSPHLAAELAGTPLEPGAILASVRGALDDARQDGVDAVVVEGVGGLLVPFVDGYDVRDLARELALPVVVVARAGLGTINHTLLTLEAARAAGLYISGVVINQWPADPDVMMRSNRETIARLGHVHVGTLATIARPDPELLVGAAAAGLSLDELLGDVRSFRM